MTKETFETWLPIFPGFYGTIFGENDGMEEAEIDNINEEREEQGLSQITWDDIEWDEGTRMNKVGEDCTDYIEKELKDHGIDVDIEFQKVSSPMFYNFENDSVHVKVTIDREYLKNKVIEYREKFDEYLKEKYTPRSGFAPFYSNRVSDWIDHEFDKETEHTIGSCLQFLLLTLTGEEEEDIEEEMFEHCNRGDSIMPIAKNYDQLVPS